MTAKLSDNLGVSEPWSEFLLREMRRGSSGVDITLSPARRDVLTAVIEVTMQAARAAWPKLAFDPERFLSYVAERIEAQQVGTLVDELRGLHAADLFLAQACVEGQAGAVASFRASFFRDAHRALAAMRVPAEQIDEVVQRVLEELVVAGPRGAPGLKGYRGRGPLRRWTRSVALRTAARLRPRAARVDDETLLDTLVDESEATHLTMLQGEYGDAFKQAFSGALLALEPSERNLLRFYYLDGATVAKIGGLLRVNASTVARRLAKARAKLKQETRRRLMMHCQIGEQDVDSLMHAVAELVDISMHRLLASDSSSQ